MQALLNTIHNHRIGKILCITAIILLYFTAYYQDQRIFSNKNGQPHQTVETKKIPSKNPTPFYQETLINRGSKMCHVSSIVSLGGNKVASCWYEGSKERGKDVAIYFATFDGKSWDTPKAIVDRKSATRELKRWVRKIGNPVMFLDQQRRLWLFYSSICVGGWSLATLNYKISLDFGETWTTSKKLLLSPFSNFTNNVKNKAVHLQNGSFLLPVYHELLSKHCLLLWIQGDEHNIHYKMSQMTYRLRAIQATILHKGRKLVALCRNCGYEQTGLVGRKRKRPKYALRVVSEDLGKTWTAIEASDLPNPNSGFDAISLNDGSYLTVANDDFYERNRLSLLKSADEGKTWKRIVILKEVPYTKSEEMSYPSIIVNDEGMFHITYSYLQQRIGHIVFNRAWLKQQEELKD